jgi:putative glutamine amidotransferase
MLDHRDDDNDPRELQYALAHEIFVEEGGILAELIADRHPRVNSLHGQGINLLAPALRVEARAPDGLIEAVSVANSRAFALGVQWHPEWRFRENALSVAMFAAFGAAVRKRYAARAAV